MKTDVLFVNPGNPRAIYQGLAEDFSAIEPPTWALLLAESVRSVGYRPAILDVNAERLSVSDAVNKIQATQARLICFVIYGQNPNSGTVNMSGAVAIATVGILLGAKSLAIHQHYGHHLLGDQLFIANPKPVCLMRKSVKWCR